MSEQPQLAVRDGDVDRGRTDVDADEPQPLGQRDHLRAPTAPGGGQPDDVDEPELAQPVELDRHLGLRKLNQLTEFGSRLRPVVAQQT